MSLESRRSLSTTRSLLIAVPFLGGFAAFDSAAADRYGANVPFVTQEAEKASTNGRVLRMRGLPRRNEASPEIEASGRSYVRLEAAGAYCEFVATKAGNALVLRHCIPDATEGGGRTATLSLYINGKFCRKLELDSRYNWLYGDVESRQGALLNEPDAKFVHVFWNDSRFLLAEHAWRQGDKVRFQKDAGDTAEYYAIDLVDLELAPPPLSPPRAKPFISVVDFGATGDDESDDTKAIKACIAEARKAGKTVWLPAGTYYHGQTFELDGVQLQGAGMWHTRLIGTGPTIGFILQGKRPRVADLFIESKAHHTRTDKGGMTFRSRPAGRWAVENVWITHTNCGFWLGDATHGKIRGCRIYCTYADAINLNRGSSHNVVEHNYIRGAGDDGIATLALKKDEAITNSNTIRFNTVICNWWGNNITVGGGSGHLVENNYLADNSHSACLAFNLPAAYPKHPLTGAVVRRNMIVRGGGNVAGQRRGAIWTLAGSTQISGVLVEGNTIVSPLFRGLHLHGSSNQEIQFKNNLIDSPGVDAVRIDAPCQGKLTLVGNDIRNIGPNQKEINNGAGEKFTLIEVARPDD